MALMGDVFNTAVGVIVTALVIWFLWYAAQPRCVLLLALEQGRLRVVRGKVTPAFVDEAQSILAEQGIGEGQIRGYLRGRAVTLAFSSAIPPDVQQRLRNVWQLHR